VNKKAKPPKKETVKKGFGFEKQEN